MLNAGNYHPPRWLRPCAHGMPRMACHTRPKAVGHWPTAGQPALPKSQHADHDVPVVRGRERGPGYGRPVTKAAPLGAVLALAMLEFFRTGTSERLDRYSDTCLRRVWKTVRYSTFMTNLLHRFSSHTPFEPWFTDGPV